MEYDGWPTASSTGLGCKGINVKLSDRLRDSLDGLFRLAFRWADPAWEPGPAMSEADWRSRHAEISKTIWNLTSLLVASSLFCLFVLGGPDASLVSTDAQISVPIASLVVSYTNFLLFGPVFLIGLTLYLHVFIEERHRLDRADRPESVTDSQTLSPFLFNLGWASAEFLSGFLFYGMLPCVLAYFVWKTIPRPGALWPLCLAFTAVSGMLVALKIRRFEAQRRFVRVLPRRFLLAVLWVTLGVTLLACLPLAWLTGRALVTLADIPQRQSARQASDPTAGIDFLLARFRRLELFGASLGKKNLTEFYGPYANLRKADLHETDLESANLAHADLRKANLTDANLTGANLQYAQLEGANLTRTTLNGADLRHATMDDRTIVDVKWIRVICILNNDWSHDCLRRNGVSWADLSGANLESADLSGKDFTGTDLSYADLSQTDLSRAVLRVADLRHTQLPPPEKRREAEGSLTAGQSGLTGAESPASVFLANRGSNNCLDAQPIVQHERETPFMFYPCAPAEDRLELWNAKRLANGVRFESAAATSTCLDASTFNDRTVQMWACNNDYATQWWRITAVTDDYLVVGQYSLVEKSGAGVCLHGTGSQENSPTPVLRTCDIHDHNQHWMIAPPDAYRLLATPVPAQTAQNRKQDLDRAIAQFRPSPANFGFYFGFQSYGFRSGYFSGGEFGP
jgi:uncharacterized protein YjbI with pentapeptide repeats